MRIFFLAIFLAAHLSAIAQTAPAQAAGPASDCEAVDKTLHDLRDLQVVAEAYYKDYKRYPDAASIEQLTPIVMPIYINRMPQKDGWGNAYLYRSFANGQAYIIASAGSDGAFNESTWTKAPRTSKDDAIVRSGQAPRVWEACK